MPFFQDFTGRWVLAADCRDGMPLNIAERSLSFALFSMFVWVSVLSFSLSLSLSVSRKSQNFPGKGRLADYARVRLSLNPETPNAEAYIIGEHGFLSSSHGLRLRLSDQLEMSQND